MARAIRTLTLGTALALLLALALPAAVAAQDDSSWYAHDGWTVEEALQTADGRAIVVMKSPDGAFVLLAPGEASSAPYALVAAGAEQVRLRRGDETVPVLLPILHHNLPLDVLLTALCRLHGKDLLVTAPLSETLVEYRPVSDEPREVVAALVEPTGAVAVTYDDLVVVAPAGAVPTAFAASTAGESTMTVDGLRSSLGSALDALTTALGTDLTMDGDPATPLTLVCSRLTPSALIHYLNGTLGAAIRLPAPPPSPVAPTVLSPEKAAKVFARVLALAKAGRTADAGRLLMKLVRRAAPDARYYRVLARLLWKAGDRRRAAQAMKKALTLAPDHAPTRSAFLKMRAALKA